MLFSFTATSILAFILGIVAFIIAAVVWTRRPAPGALPFTILMLAVAIWIVIRTFEIAAVDFSVKISLGKMLYFATAAISIMWLLFNLDYTGSTWWKRPRNILLLLIIPCISLIILLTIQWRGWNWLEIQPGVSSPGALVTWSHGPMFWMQSIYILALLLMGIILLWRFIFLNPDINRLTMAATLIGPLFPMVGHAIIVSGFYPSKGVDIAPFALTITCIIYTIAIFRFHFLDIVPVARMALVENIPDGILVLDDKGCIIEINTVATRIAGTNKSSATGKQLAHVWPELDKNVSQTDGERSVEASFETSGKKLYIEISMTTIRNNHRAIAGRLIVLRDITERNLTRRKLESLYEEERQLRNSLQEEMDKRNLYTRALVHELNTPLTSILASSDLLESEVQEKTLSFLAQNIQRSSLHLKQRISELIEFSRGEIGTLEIQLVPFNMSKLIREIVNDMTGMAEDKGILLVAYIPELPLVLGDGNRLRQALTNLIENAIKYTDKGQVTIEASNYNREALLVQVKDTGCGIDEDRMENLFNPYQRKLTNGQQLSGIGIGLALSKMFVELHKGKIWAESIPGAGSSFYFTIPLYKDAEI